MDVYGNRIPVFFGGESKSRAHLWGLAISALLLLGVGISSLEMPNEVGVQS